MANYLLTKKEKLRIELDIKFVKDVIANIESNNKVSDLPMFKTMNANLNNCLKILNGLNKIED